MRSLLLFLAAAISSGSIVHAEEIVITPEPVATRPVSGKALWQASMAALATANAMDVHSSWGKHELNPTLKGSSGTFGSQGALLKLGLQGGMMGIEYLIARKHTSGKLYRALAVINFGASATIGAVAAHNYSIPRPH